MVDMQTGILLRRIQIESSVVILRNPNASYTALQVMMGDRVDPEDAEVPARFVLGGVEALMRQQFGHESAPYKNCLAALEYIGHSLGVRGQLAP